MSHIKIVSKLQTAFTVTKILSLLIIVVVGFVYFFMGEKTTQQVTHEWFFKYPVDTGGIAMAFYNGLFAYSGW